MRRCDYNDTRQKMPIKPISMKHTSCRKSKNLKHQYVISLCPSLAYMTSGKAQTELLRMNKILAVEKGEMNAAQLLFQWNKTNRGYCFYCNDGHWTLGKMINNHPIWCGNTSNYQTICARCCLKMERFDNGKTLEKWTNSYRGSLQYMKDLKELVQKEIESNEMDEIFDNLAIKSAEQYSQGFCGFTDRKILDYLVDIASQ